MTTHVKVIAVLLLLMGVLLTLGGMFSTLLFGGLAAIAGSSGDPDAAAGVAVLGLTGAALTFFLIGYAIPHFVVAYGLLKFRNWGRIGAIVLAVLSLFKFPLGTAFGVYALVILFRKDTEAMFG